MGGNSGSNSLKVHGGGSHGGNYKPSNNNQNHNQNNHNNYINHNNHNKNNQNNNRYHQGHRPSPDHGGSDLNRAESAFWRGLGLNGLFPFSLRGLGNLGLGNFGGWGLNGFGWNGLGGGHRGGWGLFF